jgi:hypothetical protein
VYVIVGTGGERLGDDSLEEVKGRDIIKYKR